MNSLEFEENTNIFLICWDSKGLDALCQVDNAALLNDQQLIKQHMFDKLAADNGNAPDPKLYKNQIMTEVRNLMVRANINYQHRPEVYLLRTTTDINKDDIIDIFNTNPQKIVDLIRENGSLLLDLRNIVIV